jgi:hypothetical protein
MGGYAAVKPTFSAMAMDNVRREILGVLRDSAGRPEIVNSRESRNREPFYTETGMALDRGK